MYKKEPQDISNEEPSHSSYCAMVQQVIDGKGVQFGRRNLSGLKDIHSPTTAAELCEYVHCLQWMSTGIPDFANRIAPFKEVLEEAYKKSGSRTKKSIQSIRLDNLSWGLADQNLFRELQEQMAQMVILAHRDLSKALFV